MDILTKEEIEKLLTEWEYTCLQNDSLLDKLGEIGFIDGLLFSCIFRVEEQYTKLLAEKVGDNSDWLGWYRNDNDMGKNKLQAKANKKDKLKQIKNIKGLTSLIIRGRNDTTNRD